jgi:hypothetical protein
MGMSESGSEAGQAARPISRREFLKGAGRVVAAATVLAVGGGATKAVFDAATSSSSMGEQNPTEVPGGNGGASAAPKVSPGPSVKEKELSPKDAIEQKYGIDIRSNDLKNFDSDLENLDRILSAIPEGLFSPINEERVKIVIVDSEVVRERMGDTIVIPRDHLTQVENRFGVEINSAYVKLISFLSQRKDEATGYYASSNIMEILGGDKFQEDPSSVFPFFKQSFLKPFAQGLKELFVDETGQVRDKSEILAKLITELYLLPQRFDLLDVVTDPEIPGPPKINATSREIYDTIKEHFDGLEVKKIENGIPQLVNYSIVPPLEA